jgi:hypothetical protein
MFKKKMGAAKDAQSPQDCDTGVEADGTVPNNGTPISRRYNTATQTFTTKPPIAKDKNGKKGNTHKPNKPMAPRQVLTVDPGKGKSSK